MLFNRSVSDYLANLLLSTKVPYNITGSSLNKNLSFDIFIVDQFGGNFDH